MKKIPDILMIANMLDKNFLQFVTFPEIMILIQ